VSDSITRCPAPSSNQRTAWPGTISSVSRCKLSLPCPTTNPAMRRSPPSSSPPKPFNTLPWPTHNCSCRNLLHQRLQTPRLLVTVCIRATTSPRLMAGRPYQAYPGQPPYPSASPSGHPSSPYPPQNPPYPQGQYNQQQSSQSYGGQQGSYGQQGYNRPPPAPPSPYGNSAYPGQPPQQYQQPFQQQAAYGYVRR
jgi:hypothetical protein